MPLIRREIPPRYFEIDVGFSQITRLLRGRPGSCLLPSANKRLPLGTGVCSLMEDLLVISLNYDFNFEAGFAPGHAWPKPSFAAGKDIVCHALERPVLIFLWFVKSNNQ